MKISIIIDSTGGVKIDHKENVQDFPEIICALEYVKTVFLNRFTKEKAEKVFVNVEKKNYDDGVKRMRKSEALDFWLEQRGTIEERLKKIVESDDRATFTVEKNFKI
jgi:hypothetical protein